MLNNSVKRLIGICNLGASYKNKYSILTFPTHERYETQLCKTGHDFYSFSLPKSKKWNTSQTEIPDNYYILPESSLCEYIQYDLILVQSKFWQFQVAQQINQKLCIPIVCLEHTLPTPQTISPDNISMMKNMLGDMNIFISEYSKEAWGVNYNTFVVHHGIDSETFCPKDIEKENTILTVANDFVNRDYCLNYYGWKRVTDGLTTKLIGDTKGLSVSAKNTEDLVNDYNKCSVYFNSSTLSPIPTSLLEAMSCGCAVVSTATCMIPEIITNGENGFISNDENELRQYIEKLMNDTDLRNKIGSNARKTIQDKFSEQKFVNEWNNIFNIAYEAGVK